MLIVRRINDDVFLSFASIEPYFVTEVDKEAQAMINEYFPEGAEDVPFVALTDHREEEEEDYGEDELEDEDQEEDDGTEESAE